MTGYPQIIILIFNGIFPNKNHPASWGTPMAMEPRTWISAICFHDRSSAIRSGSPEAFSGSQVMDLEGPGWGPQDG